MMLYMATTRAGNDILDPARLPYEFSKADVRRRKIPPAIMLRDTKDGALGDMERARQKDGLNFTEVWNSLLYWIGKDNPVIPYINKIYCNGIDNSPLNISKIMVKNKIQRL